MLSPYNGETHGSWGNIEIQPIGVIVGLYADNEKENGNYRD